MLNTGPDHNIIAPTTTLSSSISDSTLNAPTRPILEAPTIDGSSRNSYMGHNFGGERYHKLARPGMQAKLGFRALH